MANIVGKARSAASVPNPPAGYVTVFIREDDMNLVLKKEDGSLVVLLDSGREVIAGAGLTGGGEILDDVTLDVVANADGSIIVNADDIQVGILATDTQHGNRGGGSLHANAVASGAAGFLSGSDKAKLDGIAANATNGITVQDETTPVGSNQTTFNFEGPGVDATAVGSVTTITIPGGSAIPDGDKGDITTSVVGTIWTIDNDAVTFAKMQNVASDRLIGRDTASSGDPEEITVGGGLEFTGSSGIQRSALTGDVVATAGSNATSISTNAVTTAKIADSQVTLQKLANIATDRLLGRDTGSSGVVEEISVSGGLEFSGATSIVRSALTGDVTATAGSNATTVAANAVTFSKMQDITSDRLIGRDTASSGDPEEITVSGGLEFSGSTGIVRSALTGDVTASTGSNTTTIVANAVTTTKINDAAVTLAKIQNITSDRLLGRDTASTGVTEELTVGGGLEFTGSAGIQRSALTGDVTASAGAGSTTIANDVVTFAKMQNIATDRLIGRDTASTGDPEEISVSGGLEWTGSAGIQRSALTGDVTATAGSNSTTIANSAVSNAKMANMADLRIKGNVSGGSAAPSDLTGTQVTSMLVDFVGDSGSGGTKGLVPAPASGDGASNLFLKADGTWAAPPTGGSGLSDGDYGDITVSGSATALTIDNDVVTFAKMQNVATDRLLGRDTASSGDVEELTVGGGLEFTGSTGIQRSALTGDVTASAGSNSTSIANNAVVTTKILDANVTLAKLANLAQDQFIGRVTASTGVPETATITAAARTVLDDTTVGAMVNTLGGATSTGTGGIARETSPVFTTPNIGTATGNITGNAATVTTNANLTGPVTSVGNATTITDAAVTLAKMANLAQDQFIGRITASTGVPETATITAAARTVLDDTTVGAMVDTLGGATSTGTGGIARAISPAFTTPNIGNATGNISGNAATVTTNANLTGPVTSTGNATAIANGAIALAKLANGTDGEIPTWDSSGVITTVPVGTSGHVLTSNGPGAAPTFQAAPGGGGISDGDYGDITVSGTGTVLTIDNDVVTYAKIQNVSATDRLLGRDTAAAGDVEELTVGGGLEFTGSGGIQRSALTGDVTATAGSGSTTIANNAVTTAKILDANVTLAKMANLAQDQFIGRVTASTGVPETTTITAAARTVLDDTTTAAMLTTLGGLGGTLTATDNIMMRTDGTGTKTAQGSGVTLDDANGISGHTEVQRIISGTTDTVLASDTGKVLIFTSGSAVTVTIPNTLTPGWNIRWEQRGTGKVSFNGTAVSAATLNCGSSGHVASAAQYAVGGIACYTGTGSNAVVTLFGHTGT